jgi:hypothetical protein
MSTNELLPEENTEGALETKIKRGGKRGEKQKAPNLN